MIKIERRSGFRPELFDEWLPGRQNRQLVQFGRKASAVGVGFGGCKPFAELNDLFLAGTAPADLRPATGCGHTALLDFKNSTAQIFQIVQSTTAESIENGNLRVCQMALCSRLRVVEQSHESKIHVKLLMTMEQCESRIIRHKIEVCLLIASEHHHIFHHPGHGFARHPGEFKAMPV